jgi:hypothetical protein
MNLLLIALVILFIFGVGLGYGVWGWGHGGFVGGLALGISSGLLAFLVLHLLGHRF